MSTYQSDQQTLTEYVALLRRDISGCEFVSTCDCSADISPIFLRAQFIRGIKDNAIRDQLLQHKEAKFEDIVERALALEASKIDSRELDCKQPISTDVNKIQHRTASCQKYPSRNHSKLQGRSKSRINFSQLGIDHVFV